MRCGENILTGLQAANYTCGKAKGFTLIEMSVVLAIIGLLTAAILVGENMIRQSKINSVMTDAQLYITATKNFNQQFSSLPGDMANATDYWGAMTSCPPPTSGSMAGSGNTLTCNGDGNGQINTYGLATDVNASEQFYYWQHLSIAQLIQGNYTGVSGSLGIGDPSLGVNMPAAKLDGAGFTMFYLGQKPSSTALFPSNYGHVFILGTAMANTYSFGPLLTPLEQQSFDQKYDDGMPATGIIETFAGGVSFSPYCATTSDPTTATYNTNPSSANSSGPQCAVILLTGF
jgi:prepilin-type N-terminal cleavage/methylation domain-containing protein